MCSFFILGIKVNLEANGSCYSCGAPGKGERAVQPLRCAAAKASRPSAVIGLRLRRRAERHGEKGHDRPPTLLDRVRLRGRDPHAR